MLITTASIIQAGAVVAALATIFGVIFGMYRWYLKQESQDTELVRIKEENTLVIYALSACLDGLEQLGANHTVSEAKNKLDKFINKQAHR